MGSGRILYMTLCIMTQSRRGNSFRLCIIRLESMSRDLGRISITSEKGLATTLDAIKEVRIVMR